MERIKGAAVSSAETTVARHRLDSRAERSTQTRRELFQRAERAVRGLAARLWTLIADVPRECLFRHPGPRCGSSLAGSVVTRVGGGGGWPPTPVFALHATCGCQPSVGYHL